jgi:molybdate transport system ATP-binding protein
VSGSERATLSASLSGRVGTLDLDVAFETSSRALAIVGPNGAGKSSLLAMLLGARGCKGRVAIGTRVLLDSESGRDAPIEDRRLGFVPQDGALFPHLDVRGNLGLATELARVPAAEASARIDRLLEELELGALRSRSVQGLSGGERQRLALARALVIDPVALLLDEPLSSLDARGRRDVLGFLVRVLERYPVPAVVVTHDADDVRMLDADVLVLEAGRVTQRGSLDELARSPATPFVEAFVARTLGR